MTVTLAKWTIADYHQMIEFGVLDDKQVELIWGDIVEKPTEGPEHAQTNTDGRDRLSNLLGDRVLIRDGKPITLYDQSSEPEPDLAVVQTLRETEYREHHPYPEDIFLLVEYSKLTVERDTIVKRKLYAEAGIQDYWVVNLQDRQVVVHRDPIDGDYRSPQTLTSGSITMLAFPDVAIDIGQLR
jgi:Uma2 family endonuclease